MKLSVTILLLCLIICSACNNKATPFLQTGNLQSSFIHIDADSAYTLRTGKGAVITIAAGSFDVEDNGKVSIEIKEAFTMQEILLAGLTTESNGRPLQSGGMIYFNATSEGKQLDIKKPIGISIPSDSYDPAMQLYKGEIKADSSVNWVDPQPLDTTPNAQMILDGRILFRNHCRSCHKLSVDFTGPPLQGLSSRVPNRQWIYDFMKSPAKMIAKKDPYAVQLYEKWKPTVMTAFPLLSNRAIDAIIAYAENERRINPGAETDSLPYTAASNTTVPAIDCGYDTVFLPSKEMYKDIVIIRDTNPAINPIPDPVEANDPVAPLPDNKPRKAASTEVLRSGFTDDGTTSGMYDFTIQTNGWYNIDAEVEGYEGSKEVTLSVTLNGLSKGGANVYLFCPSRKMLSVGLDKGSNIFKFEKINGKIPLFLGEEAVLIAFGSSDEQMLYGTHRFTIAASQQFVIDMKATTGEAIQTFIKNNRIDGIKINSYKKEYDVIRKPCDTYGSDTSTIDEAAYLY